MDIRCEYALEVYDSRTDKFVRQIDVFERFDDALLYGEEHPLSSFYEFYRITEIEYNYFGEEVAIC